MTVENAHRRQLMFFGTCNLDLCLFVEKLPARGESVIGSLQEFPGGKGANQAVAAARLGGAPLFYTRLGDDEAGRLLRQALADAGVQQEALRIVPGEKTGTALIMVDRAGANMIGIEPGANNTAVAEDVDAALCLAEPGSVIVAEMGLPLPMLRHLFARASDGGHFLIFNPAPVTGHLDRQDWERIDVVTPNETEGEELTGIRIGDITSAEAAAERILEIGARAVVITLGDKGAVFADGQTMAHFPAFPVRAVDTTAAGDAFNGGLALAIARGESLQPAIRYGMAVAALSVTRPGAQNSMPSAEEVDHFMTLAGIQ